LGGSGPNNGAYCRDNVQVCTNFLTSSVCTDCTAPNTAWMYGASNGNFIALSNQSAYNHLCMISKVPNY
jgi:hypothetical protein